MTLLQRQVVTLSNQASKAGRELISWLAYPDPKNAARAIEWLRSWSAYNIQKQGKVPLAPPSLKWGRLERNLASLEHRLTQRLIMGEQAALRLSSAAMDLPPWRDLPQDPTGHVAAWSNLRSQYKDGGTMALPLYKLSDGTELVIELEIPPMGTRARAKKTIDRKSFGTVENEIRRMVPTSRPVLHLAAACSETLAPIILHEGLGAAAFRGEWVESALHRAENYAAQFLASPSLGTPHETLIKFQMG